MARKEPELKVDWPFGEISLSSLATAVRIGNEVSNESDRASVLIIAAFLDEQLGLLLNAHFVGEEKIRESLLSQSGPLGSFGSRSKLCYCLDLINRTCFEDLEVIRKLRNEFAHSHVQVSFASKRSQDLVQNLRMISLVPEIEKAAKANALFSPIDTSRGQFLLHGMALFVYLINRCELSRCGIVDSIRFMERDAANNNGEHFQKLVKFNEETEKYSKGKIKKKSPVRRSPRKDSSK